MPENKTKPAKNSFISFLNALGYEEKRKDAQTFLDIIKDITHKTPVVWGESITGLGSYQDKYDSGREGTMSMTRFSGQHQFSEHLELHKTTLQYTTECAGSIDIIML